MPLGKQDAVRGDALKHWAEFNHQVQGRLRQDVRRDAEECGARASKK